MTEYLFVGGPFHSQRKDIADHVPFIKAPLYQRGLEVRLAAVMQGISVDADAGLPDGLLELREIQAMTGSQRHISDPFGLTPTDAMICSYTKMRVDGVACFVLDDLHRLRGANHVQLAFHDAQFAARMARIMATAAK